MSTADHCPCSIYIFVGPPGAGKGSLSQHCVSRFGFKQFSTGNMCRWHVANKTSIGEEIDLAIKSGKLISDRLVTDMVGEWLSEQLEEAEQSSDTVILDGYPRTTAQVSALGGLLESDDLKKEQVCVVKLAIDDEKIVSRLSQRYVCRNKACQVVYSLAKGSAFAPKAGMTCDACGDVIVRRSDDTEGAVRDRLRVYREHETELVEACRLAGWPVFELNADAPFNQLVGDFKQIAGLSEQ